MDLLNDIVIYPIVSVELILHTLVILFLSIAFYFSINILYLYKRNATSSLQYELEKKSFLITSIIKLSLYIFIFLFVLFALSIDALAQIITGAMCGAGVVGFGEYGELLIALKFITIIFSMLWITVDKKDQRGKGFPYFSKKLYFFLFIYLSLLISYIVEVNFFLSLSTQEPVLCCSSLYSLGTNSFLFGMNIETIIVLFYLNYLAVLLSAFFQKKVFLALFSSLFFYFSYISIVYFFSTYIYELPTHMCPYCILGKEYYYLGYFIYGVFVVANYYALYGLVFSLSLNIRKKLILAYSVFVVLVSFKYVYYYLVNNLFL
jgi:hypothetical protein